jgi:predicted HicB family RNase H-like nuclease
MVGDINIRVSKETHKRLKVKASQRGKKIKQHVDDLSKLSTKLVDIEWKGNEDNNK